VRPKDSLQPGIQDSIVYNISCECDKVYTRETGRAMWERKSEHYRDIRLARIQFQNMPKRQGIFSFGTKSSLLFLTLTGTMYTTRVQEVIHTRLHQNNINRNNGIKIPEAWIPTIRKHNSRWLRMRTYAGTALQSWNNNENQNPPIAANQGATNSNKSKLTSSLHED